MVRPHYLAPLFVPIALVSPMLSWLWLMPLLAYRWRRRTAGRG